MSFSEYNPRKDAKNMVTPPRGRDLEAGMAFGVHELMTQLELIPQNADFLIQHPYLDPASNNEVKVAWDIVGQGTILSPDSPMLASTYQQLQQTIDDPQSPHEHKLHSAVVADILLHQTQKPIEQKQHVKDMKEVLGKFPSMLVSVVGNSISNGTKPTEESRATMSRLSTTVDSFFEDRERETFDQATSTEQLREQLSTIGEYNRLKNAHIMTRWENRGNPIHQKQEQNQFHNKLNTVVTNPLSEALLLEGELEESPNSIKERVWEERMNVYGKSSDPQDQDKAKAVGDYFLTHPDTQKVIWDDLTKPRQQAHQLPEELKKDSVHFETVPLEYDRFSWFFKQEQETIQQFIKTADQDSFTKNQKNILLKKMIGYAAIFKTLNPEHPNTGHVVDAIEQFARDTAAERLANQSLQILRDEKPGAISMRQNFETRGRIADSQTDLDKITGGEKNNLLYVSQAEIVEPTRPTEKIIFIKEDEDSGPKPYELPTGKPMKIDYWGTPHEVPTDAVEGLVNHLQERFAPDEDKLLDWVSNQPTQNTFYREQSSVIPPLMEKSHPLNSLGEIGIMNVQRTKNDFVIVLDTDKAHVTTEGTSRVCLKGELDGQGEFIMNGSQEDFVGTPLQIALTGAALLARRATELGTLTEKQQTQTRQLTGNWNREYPNYPHLKHATPDHDELAVVMPVGLEKTTMLTVTSKK